MLSRPHRGLITLLLSLAMLATIAGAGAFWVDHALLSPGRWAATSRRLIDDRTIRRAIAGFTAQRALAASGVDAAIDRTLPGALAGRARGALRGASTAASESLLATRAGRESWVRANRQAVVGLNDTVDHPRRRGELSLELTPLLRDVVGSVAGSSAARLIPGSAQLFTVGGGDPGRLSLLDRAEVDSVRRGVVTVRTLAWALPALALLLFALSLTLAVGWRVIALAAVGYRLLLAGGIVLLARALAQFPLSDVFVSSATDRGAVRAAWLISTVGLRDEAFGLLIAGAVIAAASWGLRALAR